MSASGGDAERDAGRVRDPRIEAGSGVEPPVCIAGVVIETRPGQGPFVACRLEGRAELELVGGDGDCRLAAVWTAGSGRQLLEAAEHLVQEDDDVLGVYPTFVGQDGGETPQTDPKETARNAMKVRGTSRTQLPTDEESR